MHLSENDTCQNHLQNSNVDLNVNLSSSVFTMSKKPSLTEKLVHSSINQRTQAHYPSVWFIKSYKTPPPLYIILADSCTAFKWPRPTPPGQADTKPDVSHSGSWGGVYYSSIKSERKVQRASRKDGSQLLYFPFSPRQQMSGCEKMPEHWTKKDRRLYKKWYGAFRVKPLQRSVRQQVS